MPLWTTKSSTYRAISASYAFGGGYGGKRRSRKVRATEIPVAWATYPSDCCQTCGKQIGALRRALEPVLGWALGAHECIGR